jgi:type IV pilus assembly protein PilY1
MRVTQRRITGGDIINSNPAYLADKPANSGSFGRFPGYADFFKLFDPKQGGTARAAALYVGANDGMLHAFNATKLSDGGGKELFAFVPNSVYYKLPLLASQNFKVAGGHRYTVDGSPYVLDTNLGSGGSPNWATVLYGTLGAGGAGVFALDVSRPEAFNSSKVLWEFSAPDSLRSVAGVSKADLGATTGQVRVARIKQSSTEEKWYALFGNGYDSTQNPTHGAPVLFVALAGKAPGAAWAEGTNFYRIVLSNDTDNGLSTPAPVDSDGDGFVDLIYAGDLKGNLWRVKVSDPNPANWTVCKIFTTAAGQPITVAPTVAAHSEGGLSINFGTGKYLESTDVTVVPPTQSLYGIRDINPASNTCPTVGTLGACPSPSANGWKRDLPSPGERQVVDSELLFGNLIVPTLIPSTDICSGGGSGRVFTLEPEGRTCGATPPLEPGATQAPRYLTSALFPSGTNDSAGGGAQVRVDENGRRITEIKLITIRNVDGDPVSEQRVISINSGRLTWREIVKD